MKIRSAVAILAAATLAACAGPGPQASGTFHTHASYDRLFSAAMAAAPEVGYHATSINRADGLITAEQNVIMGRGTAIGMTAVLSKQGSVNTLTVTFVAPPGTFAMGDFGENVSEYMTAVRAVVPDLQAAR